MNTILVVLSSATHFCWDLHQLDDMNVFLHIALGEEVYMEILPGFETHSGRNKVCLLKMALYGLKQIPRTWFDRFMIMVSKGHKQSQRDYTLFT